jgi:hypothetical protein
VRLHLTLGHAAAGSFGKAASTVRIKCVHAREDFSAGHALTPKYAHRDSDPFVEMPFFYAECDLESLSFAEDSNLPFQRKREAF